MWHVLTWFLRIKKWQFLMIFCSLLSILVFSCVDYVVVTCVSGVTWHVKVQAKLSECLYRSPCGSIRESGLLSWDSICIRLIFVLNLENRPALKLCHACCSGHKIRQRKRWWHRQWRTSQNIHTCYIAASSVFHVSTCCCAQFLNRCLDIFLEENLLSLQVVLANVHQRWTMQCIPVHFWKSLLNNIYRKFVSN